jgi:hypothetical protein
MANDIKITLAGDPAGASRAFRTVDDAATKMSRSVDDATDGFTKAGQAADEVDTKAMGFRDTLTGVQDTMGGIAELSKGPSVEGFLTLGAGIGDLGSGLYNTIIPGMKSAATWIRAGGIASAWSAIQVGIVSAATKVWAGVQWLLNGLIIIAVIALIAIIVVIATKTTWFQDIWKMVWGGIVAYFNWVKEMYVAAFNAIVGVGERVWGWLTGLPSRLKSAFSGVGSFITAPFRTAFNFVADAWNRTIGSMSWRVPDWVPGIGGNSISAPKLPKFHDGGIVPGAPGQEMLAILQAGERITPAGAGGGGNSVRVLYGGDPAALEFLRRLVRFEAAGDVQLAFGDG